MSAGRNLLEGEGSDFEPVAKPDALAALIQNIDDTQAQAAIEAVEKAIQDKNSASETIGRILKIAGGGRCIHC